MNRLRRVGRASATAILCAGTISGCVANPRSGAATAAGQGQVSVAPNEVVVRYPASAMRNGMCPFRGRNPGEQIYFWSLHVGSGNPWHTIDVEAAVPDSLAEGSTSFVAILRYARAGAYRVGGEPPMRMAVLDTAARITTSGDTTLVVRVANRRAIRDIFAERPRHARFHLCAEDSLRQVRVRYEPGF